MLLNIGHRDMPINYSVVDIGFGLAAMLHEFPTHCEIAGTELSEQAVTAAYLISVKKGYQKMDFRVFEPDYVYPLEWEMRFDYAIVSHVLEHIEDPESALIEITNLVKSGGTLCIAVPVNERLGEDLNHFHCFTEESFRQLLTDCGLEVENMSSCDCVWNIIKGVAHSNQKKYKVWKHVLIIMFNLATIPLTGRMLKWIDAILRRIGYDYTQCFAIVKVPSK